MAIDAACVLTYAARQHPAIAEYAMPALSEIVLRYVIGVIVLRVIYVLLVNLTGLPDLEASQVILATLPATDAGMQIARRATRPLVVADWAKVWAVLMVVYVALMIMPALFFAASGRVEAAPDAVSALGMVVLASGVMMAIFLMIGARIPSGGRS
jgi:hypothetical protein